MDIFKIIQINNKSFDIEIKFNAKDIVDYSFDFLYILRL